MTLFRPNDRDVLLMSRDDSGVWIVYRGEINGESCIRADNLDTGVVCMARNLKAIYSMLERRIRFDRYTKINPEWWKDWE